MSEVIVLSLTFICYTIMGFVLGFLAGKYIGKE
jgi:hypothetical protein